VGEAAAARNEDPAEVDGVAPAPGAGGAPVVAVLDRAAERPPLPHAPTKVTTAASAPAAKTCRRLTGATLRPASRPATPPLSAQLQRSAGPQRLRPPPPPPGMFTPSPGPPASLTPPGER